MKGSDRNKKCPCGSDKKWKNCCLNKEDISNEESNKYSSKKMNEKTKKDKAFLIADNRRAIKSLEAKKALKEDPNLIEKDKERSRMEIALKLPTLEQYFSELLPFIKNLRGYVQDITEETFICAVYLSLSHACQDWKSLFSLARNGDYGSFAFVRLIKEAIALSDLFVLDSRKNKHKHLSEWFKGEIVGHGACRIAQDEFMQEGGMVVDEMKNIASHIYQMESLVIHGSYISMIESVSPFTEDFDYDGRTQYSRTNNGLDYAKGVMDAMNINLKLVYGQLIGDKEKYEQLDKILTKYSAW